MKNLTFIITLFFLQTSYAQTDSCHISIHAAGYNSGVAKLISIYGDHNFLADSAIIDPTGKFEFKRKSPFKPGYFYVILPDNGNLHLILDQDQHFNMRTSKPDLLADMLVENSIDNQLLYESLKLQIKLDKELDSLNNLKQPGYSEKELADFKDQQQKRVQLEKKKQVDYFQQKYPRSFFTKFKTAGQNPELVEIKKENGELDKEQQFALFRQAFWDNVDLNDIRLLHTPVIANKLKRFITEFTTQQPDSIIRQADLIIDKSLGNQEMFKFISNWIAVNYQPTQTKVMDGEAVMVHIMDKYFKKELAGWLTDKDVTAITKKVFEMKSSLLNCTGPDVVSRDLYGNMRSIYELKEDFVIVFMYDPDCDHCEKETPLLREFYKEWKSKSIEIFAIVLNSTDKQWRDFVLKNQIDSWINVHDPTNLSIYGKYFVDITPEIYVLNKERKIIGKNLKPEQIPIIIRQELDRSKK